MPKFNRYTHQTSNALKAGTKYNSNNNDIFLSLNANALNFVINKRLFAFLFYKIIFEKLPEFTLTFHYKEWDNSKITY
ncbi:hypothetical protein ES332_D05G022200v1 [Gossypium tomentosum]|uniref:Uncharacterized protein n=1 Tax=Gossypium tomentosum TaxID=34277 RepID=A0A5D2KSE1_GOSTO|nr:hypothetical protein ES332_D05G022200v1 [Gossypium tomentosum]